jgi:glycosyltransferase involved in cell wall biosynthesis
MPDLASPREDAPPGGFRRVALSHEWLTIPGGSEKVVMAILELFEQAEIYTSVYDPAPWPEAITSRPVHTSLLNRVPRASSIYPKLLPFMDRAFRSFDLSGHDLVISSNHACAKNVRKPDGVSHICYCHTPMRYAWDPTFLAGEQLGTVPRIAFNALAPHLRRRDRAAAQLPGGPDLILANSSFVAERIRRHWGRESQVVHPPVEVDRFTSVVHDPEDYYLFLGRLVPYKKADLAVAACARLGRRLKVVGGGRALDDVRALAGPGTEFLGSVSDAELPALLGGARALLFPGEEDFGIVPVEAQAAGLPVIAYGSGGARDTVVDGVTGILYDDGAAEGLAAAIERFEPLRFDDAALRAHAARFAPDRFARLFSGAVASLAAG